ncbi:RNA-guided endonuclease InsQ/TnpB family protein [Ktedonobacter racemifer]|uniref:Putative transposase IS891/IS1136/IS1341 family n=1 Tax=Ktedonobacter racemifer DSM 44963 TaxID=485913 RepID=D6TGC9_KTERA|nr:RNA-guided endonuclease TnpB family protein [Ktedonobacter racemifer]EFH90641.1 putative transposase IS891/IS1136/IS1341 family [Ktedonobacter racemifer DSM 44963]
MEDARETPERQPDETALPVRVKASVYRLYPTRKQEGTLLWTLRRCKELYNASLEERTAAYKMAGVSVSYGMQSEQLPQLKEERPEYQEIYSQVQQDVLRRLDKAMKAFFRRVDEGQPPGYPRYKSNARYRSFTYPQSGYEIIGALTSHDTKKKKTCRLKLSKIGHLKMVMHRPIKGTIKGCTIKHDGDQWYAVFSVEQAIGATPVHPSTKTVGIDMGITSYATLSTGEQIANPRIYRSTEQQIKEAHRRLSRRKRGSHRRARAKRALTRLYRKVRHRRQDFLHKASRQLVNQYGMLVFEALQIPNMTARPKLKPAEAPAPLQGSNSGTAAAVTHYLPNGAAAKGGLNKSILDAAWGRFITLCACKAEEAGGMVVKVAPQQTSQLCSGCGVLVPKDLSVRWHSCPTCGAELDRDENAALNILRRYELHGPIRERKKRKATRKVVGAGSAPQRSVPSKEGADHCRSPRL